MNQKKEENKSDQSKSFSDKKITQIGEAAKLIIEEEKRKFERDSKHLKTHLEALKSANKNN